MFFFIYRDAHFSHWFADISELLSHFRIYLICSVESVILELLWSDRNLPYDMVLPQITLGVY